MKRIKYLLLGMILGGAAVFAALKYHVLRTASGFEVVPKVEASLSDTYVDVREFGAGDWTEHEQLVAAILRADREDILQNAAVDQLRQTVDGLLDRIGS